MLDEIDDSTFKEKIGEGTCLVLFYKDPCPFCKAMKGAIGKFAGKRPDLRTMQINGLDNPGAAGEMGVERYPDVIFFKDGAQVGRHKGLGSPKDLAKVYGQI
jgi:thioredoxin 1